MELHVPQLLFQKFLEPKDQIESRFGLYGEYHVIKKRHGVIVQELKFKNVITDIGLQRLASTSEQANTTCYYLQLGTGVTTPTTTDTSLKARGFGPADRSSLDTGGFGADWWMQATWEIGLAAAIGTWSEVGNGWTKSSPYSVFSRTLFKDDNGNPILVEKTSNDTLTIIYKLHIVRVSDAPFSSVVNVAGVGNVTVESLMLNQGLERLRSDVFLNASPNYGCYLGSDNSALDPTRSGAMAEPLRSPHTKKPASLYQFVDYVSPNANRDAIIEWPSSVVGNIGEACINITNQYYACLMMRFDPVIPKDDTKKFRLGYRLTFNRV